MREIIDELQAWRAAGQRVALARVVDVAGSGPRLPGAAMAVNEAGEVIGSVSGGCVEGAVVSEALDVLSGKHTAHLCHFGYSDDDAFAVGLTCGGTIHLFIEEVTGATATAVDAVAAAITDEVPLAIATLADGPGAVGSTLIVAEDGQPSGTLGHPMLDHAVARDAIGELDSGRSGVRHYGPEGEAQQNEVSVYVETYAPLPRMVIFGAVDFTAALARVAKLLGYRVLVCDARRTFATTRRFPMADEVRVDWPGRVMEELGPKLTAKDAVCILTHDPKFDVPAVVGALASNVGYIGVMGSRRTHEARTERLREVGVDDAGLARLCSPIGLDLGARTPEETAVAIAAEIIGLKAGKDIPQLRSSTGPIHAPLISALAGKRLGTDPGGTAAGDR